MLHAIPAPVMAQVADSTFWTARDTTIGADAARARVRIAIWDSGVDTVLFHDRLARDGQGRPLIRGYDAFKERQDLPLAVLPDSIAQRSAQLNRWLCAMDDIDSGVDSPQARELNAWLDTLTEAQEEAFYGTIERYSGYTHGTALADITLNGLEQAELVIARMEWWHGSPPVPCWSRELADKEAASIRDLLDFIVAQGARVVVMSWMRTERGYVRNLEQCAPDMPETERKALARYTVERIRAELIAGMKEAPQVLFIGAAGNRGDALAEADQATRFTLPNFMLVGAVDQQGRAVGWSNTGPEVIIRARGERVPARLPDGTLSHPTGTSMSAPVAANAVAKMLAVEPGLSVEEIRTWLLDTATPMADHGPPLLHTRAAVRAAGGR
ncbi:MAG TPA: S8 family serine peptidase [Flavobacteriales bacterium]|nr:S8 family serine peptidase [Flavobacteriales bacterium]